MSKSIIKVGDPVTKVTGDYNFDGEIVSAFTKASGDRRFVVEDERGALHIYSSSNLRHIGNQADHQYLRILRKLIEGGEKREGRNGVTRSLFGEQMRFNLKDGFPLLTTKKVHFHSVVTELLWFLRGDTNTKFLKDHNVSIWDEWADANGNLGPVYGKQWRSWATPVAERALDVGVELTDQIADVIKGIKSDPYSRRHMVVAWNPGEIHAMALPPCHCLFQFHVGENGLSCHLYQRSADWFLGVPFNIASYALLTHLIARQTGLLPHELVISFGDLHVYENHIDQAREQLLRAPKQLPTLAIGRDRGQEIALEKLMPADISLVNYQSHPAIKAPVSK